VTTANKTLTKDNTLISWLGCSFLLAIDYMNTAIEIHALYQLTEQVLLCWLDNMPPDIRELKALELLSDSCQLLHSACVNLGVSGKE